MVDKPQHLVFKLEFLSLFGKFHAAWSSVDMMTDFAIGQFMNLPHEQTHLLTAGMAVGAKFRILADLIGRSGHPKKGELLGALNKIRGETKREILTHSYIQSSDVHVNFLDRKGGGKYNAKEHPFTLPEFTAHVKTLTQAGEDFELALGMTLADAEAFAAAALSANNRE